MEICQTSNCDNSAIAICLHCNEFLCVEHLLQHNEQLINDANTYCDEFNRLTEQIEHLSFDKQFQSAEEDLNEWLNEQMKQLDQIYENQLADLKRAQIEMKKKVKNFQESQRKKILDIRRLFNSKLNKQISLEQLNRMKNTIQQFRDELEQFQLTQPSITFIPHPQNHSPSKAHIGTQIEESKPFQLNADAKPFEYNLDKSFHMVSTI